jgi:ribosomal protein S12 methylthiotransferase accessory factor
MGNGFEERITKGFATLGLCPELLRSDPVDFAGVPVYRVELSDIAEPTGFGGMRSWGKGLTSEWSRRGALAEAVERCCAYEHIGVAKVRASYNELGAAALDPCHFLPTAPELVPAARRPHYFPDVPLDWVEARNYHTGKSVYVPTAWVYLYPPMKDGLVSATSSGLAAGNSEESAILHALCEVVERDAAMILMRHRLVRKIIEPPPAVGHVIEKLHAGGVEVVLRSIATDIDIPSVVALCQDKEDRFPSMTYGFGVHPDTEIACIRAVTEAAQSRVVEIHHWRTFGLRQFGPRELGTIFAHLLAPSPSRPLPPALPATDDLGAMIKTCLTRVRKALPRTDLYVAHLTRPEFEVPVVRVLVPGLVPPQANYPLVVPRLLSVPRVLGFAARDTAPHELWAGTWPH